MKQLEPTAIIASGLSLAGMSEIGIIDAMPKGALISLVFSMFGIILFFARRDYARITGAIELGAKALSEAGKKIDNNHNAVMQELSGCVRVTENSATINKLYARVNNNDRRLVRLETQAGLQELQGEDEQAG